MGRYSFVLRRLVQLIPVAFGITFISFFLIHLIPGDPVAAILGNHYTEQGARSLRAALGLDKPLVTQYLIFLGRLLHGDLGDSIYYEQPVVTVIAERVWPTVWLVLYAALLSVAIAVPLALLAALRRNGLADQAIRAVFMVALAMPSFWTGIVLIIVLSIKLHLFPVSGFGDNPLDHVWHLFLPALTIALGFCAILIRSLRNSTLQVLRADYVDTARAKGLRFRPIMVRHVLPNALLSTITIFGVNVAFLLGTTVVVENVFAIGGIGQLLVSAILQRDYAVVQGLTLLLAVCVVGVNLLIDIAYTVLDPRVSYD